MKEKIISRLKKVVKALGIETDFQVEKPANPAFGDYSTNLALIASKKINKNTKELAESIVKLLNEEKIENIDKIEIAGSGFINFWLSEEFLVNQLNGLLTKNNSSSLILKHKKIIIEFTDPNPFKEFHVGHLYSNTVGECISRILSASGAIVKRANYQGDIGLHVAKAVWGIKKLGKEKLKKGNLEEKAKFLGQAYSLGAKTYEEEERIKEEINTINKKLYDGTKDYKDLYDEGRKISLEYFEKIYKRLGTHFDYYYFESEVGKLGLKLVEENIKTGNFLESEGAVIFEGEKYGLHNRVFINSLGLPTYEAKELALAGRKYEDFKYDESIVVTGNEITEYFKVVMAALEKINPDLAKKTKHLTHGMVRLPQGKMSSRLGNIVSYEWLLDEVKARLKEKFANIQDNTLEKVTIAAVKYTLLKTRLGKDIEFNFERSISLEGDSGPYLQYAYVRTQGIVKKSKVTRLTKAPARRESQKSKLPDTKYKTLNDEEISLLRYLNSFPEIVESAAITSSPNAICDYLFDLAQNFNFFYQKHKIIEGENEEFRLVLTEGIGKTLKKGLEILGIESPSQM